MYQEFLTFIGKNKLLDKQDKVLVGVSGGVDSMVLLHLLVASGFEVGVAHVNYHLRGEDSDLDAELVQQVCQKSKMPFFSLGAHPKQSEESGSLQMVARNIRYQFYDELKVKHGFTKLATAHHANDNLETILFNLSKGSGISGIAGMQPIHDDRVKPLLFASKTEIYEFAKSEKLEWREDATNQANDYHRNQIRNVVIPELEKINPSLLETFQDTALRLQGARATIAEKKSEILERYVSYENGFEVFNTGWVVNDAKSHNLLFEILKDYGLNFKQCSDLFKAILDKSTGAEFFSEDFHINLDRDRLLISSKTTGDEKPVIVNEAESTSSFGEVEFSFESRSFDGTIFKSPKVAILDQRKLKYPLVIRKWKDGDSFYPLGMQGRKKISDFLIDNKVPLIVKKDVLVIESENEIIWLVGHRIDDRFKVEDTTNKVLKVSI